MENTAKTYSELRNQYKWKSEFMWFFGQLSEEDARKLIENEETSAMDKAAMFETWKRAKSEYDWKKSSKKPTLEERQFMEDCEKHWEYPTIEIYIEAVKRWLSLSPWQYTPTQAEERIEERMHFIIESYEKGDTVADTAVEVGYVCG